jgi:hypothetical protein
MSGWIHMPKSSGEYLYYTMLCGDYEAFAYGQLGELTLINTVDDCKISIKHCKKARAIYNLVGMTDQATVMETKIKIAMLALNDMNLSSTVTRSSMLQTSKDDYEKTLNDNGIESIFTIRIISSRLFDMKMTVKFVSSQDRSLSQGRWMRRGYIVSRVISYYLL